MKHRKTGQMWGERRNQAPAVVRKIRDHNNYSIMFSTTKVKENFSELFSQYWLTMSANKTTTKCVFCRLGGGPILHRTCTFGGSVRIETSAVIQWDSGSECYIIFSVSTHAVPFLHYIVFCVCITEVKIWRTRLIIITKRGVAVGWNDDKETHS